MTKRRGLSRSSGSIDGSNSYVTVDLCARIWTPDDGEASVLASDWGLSSIPSNLNCLMGTTLASFSVRTLRGLCGTFQLKFNFHKQRKTFWLRLKFWWEIYENGKQCKYCRSSLGAYRMAWVRREAGNINDKASLTFNEIFSIEISFSFSILNIFTLIQLPMTLLS